MRSLVFSIMKYTPLIVHITEMGTIMALCNIVLSSIVWRSIGREKLYIVRIKSFGMTVVTYILMGKL